MNIVLIGMRGSGKTKIARLLAENLNKKYISTDQIIEIDEDMKIKDIVKKSGWSEFRKKEKEVVKTVSSWNNCVIDTGGGVVLSFSNLNNLKNNGVLIYLFSNIETLMSRVGDDKNRPFITGARTMKKDLKNTFDKRKNLYKKAADFMISTENQKPDDICQKIIKFLEDRKAL